MELEEFVFQSITQIAKGIERAQEESNGRYLVSPPHMTHQNGISTLIMPDKQYSDTLEAIDFDVAVSASDKSSVGGKLFVQVLNIGGKHESQDLNCSRIRFQVMVKLPRQA